MPPHNAGFLTSFVFLVVAALCVQSALQVGPHRDRSSKDFNQAALFSTSFNASALALFERSRLSYERAYDYYGRVPEKLALPHHALTLDFEIETSAQVKLTPELLLQRGSIDLSSKPARKETHVQEGFYRRSGDENSWDPPSTIWPKVSDYFTLGIDGTGKFVTPDDNASLVGKRYRQGLGGQIEIETILMRPDDVLRSSFTQELQVVIQRLWDEKKNHSKALHGSHWYTLPFIGAEGIKIHGSNSPTRACSKCHVQWTVGLAMDEVPSLLAMTTSGELQRILHRVDGICFRREDGCVQEYKAFISLAAWTLSMVRQCEGCNHPKRCASPWLVRTHFGDLAMHMKDRLGMNSLQNMAVDVLEAAQVQKDDQVLPHGVVDYLRFPEVAEMSGFVFPRAESRQSKENCEDIPTTPEGLLQLSSRMLKDAKGIHEAMISRGCGIHGRNDFRVSDFTAEEWLRGLLRGKDLMSDHDSQISESSFSHLVWKSMGSWRMKPGSNRVYLECRHSDECLGTGGMPGAAALIHAVAERMEKLERTIKEKRLHEPLAKGPSQSSWIRRNLKTPKSMKKMQVAAEVKPYGQLIRKRKTNF